MMKIAIAGTNGLAQFVAFYLTETTSHGVVFLSRTPNQGLKDKGWQVLSVDYQKRPALVYSLTGFDIVISTISGQSQIMLIEAAAEARVRLFIPSAFSGPEQCSPQATEKPAWTSALDKLAHHKQNSRMSYCLFTCGIFYERFGPGGLSQSQISTNANPNRGIGGEGEFLIDYHEGIARQPIQTNDREAYICLTSARDAARYIVAAIQSFTNLSAWPTEFKICTERMTVSALATLVSRIRGTPLNISAYTAASLASSLAFAHAVRDLGKEQRLEQFIAAAEGAFDFDMNAVNLNEQVLLSVRVTGADDPIGAERLEPWLRRVWGGSTLSASTSTSGSGTTSRR